MRSEQRPLPFRVFVRFRPSPRQQCRRSHRRPDASARYGADLSVGELDLEALALPDLGRAPQRSLGLIPHKREAARQHAAITHCAEQLPSGEKLSPPALQAFVICAGQEGRKPRDCFRPLAASPSQ